MVPSSDLASRTCRATSFVGLIAPHTRSAPFSPGARWPTPPLQSPYLVTMRAPRPPPKGSVSASSTPAVTDIIVKSVSTNSLGSARKVNGMRPRLSSLNSPCNSRRLIRDSLPTSLSIADPATTSRLLPNLDAWCSCDSRCQPWSSACCASSDC
jgi:hypothetical protein